MRRIKNKEDFFLGGRRFGKLVLVFAAFGQSVNTSSSVSATTTTAANGASGIWSSLNYVFGTPLYWFTSVWYRRLRLLTMGDYFEDRFGSKLMSGTYAIVSCLGFMVMISLGFNAMGKTVVALTPKSVERLTEVEKVEYNKALELESLEQSDFTSLSMEQRDQLANLRMLNPRKVFSHISREALICFVCALVLLYASAGGLEAAFITDLIQGMFILALSIMLLPFAWAKINTIYGGEGVFDALRTMHERLPESYFEILGSPTSIDFTWYYIIALTFMISINFGVLANQLVSSGSAKDEYSARFGFTVGLYMKRLCAVLWGMFALAAVLLYGKTIRDPDLIYGHAVLDLLGPPGLGLVGLMIACLMAALMSSADFQMIASAGLITQNVYRPLFPNFSEMHYVWAGRIFGAGVVIGGGYVAITCSSIFEQLKLSWEINSIFAASFWMGMIWRKANCKAAWASIFVTCSIFFVVPLLLPIIDPAISSNPYLAAHTNPAPISRSYVAHEMDIEAREAEIAHWDELKAEGKGNGPRPEPIELGKRFTKVYQLPQKSIFWSRGVQSNEEAVLEGHGLLNLGLVVLDKLGCDLSANSYAFNETLRIVLRILVPFGIFVVVALVTPSDDQQLIDRFYVKMKTEVLPDHEADQENLEKSYSTPNRFDHLKLFPKSNWEFCKWSKVDAIGFLLSVLTAFGIVGLFFVALSIGS
ncbi:sodium:solute symporter family protein [Adhaeretor mobilis]|nr:sodium:solute symporter family protein [Adhaeretor mobilis]